MANIPIGGQLDFPYQIANVDKRFGPYASVAAAYAALGPDGDDVITAGLPFGITEADGSTTWCIWTKTGGEVTDYKRISHMQVVPFAGVVTTSVTIAQVGGLSQDGSTIKYLAAHNTFGYQSGTSYVTTWQNDYIWIDGDTRAPYKDILYVDKVNGSAYFYNGTVLIELTPHVTIPVTSVNGKTGAVVLNKSDIGLGNVDNTSDVNKPISTATQTALDAKANASDLTSHTGNTNNPHQVTKAQVGLGNVDNTADADKNVNSAVKDGSGNTITDTYETKTHATSNYSSLQGDIDSLAAIAANLTGLEGTNFGGFSLAVDAATAVSNIPTVFTQNGCTVGQLYWFLAGADMSALVAYKYNGTGSATAISATEYDFTDFSGLSEQVKDFKGTITSLSALDALYNTSDVGVYHLKVSQMSGLLIVEKHNDGLTTTISQQLIGSGTPTNQGGSYVIEAGQTLARRTYSSGAWTAWNDPIATLKSQVDALGPKIDQIKTDYLPQLTNNVDSPVSETGTVRENGTLDAEGTYKIVRPIALNPNDTIVVNQGAQVYIGSNTALLFECDSNGNWVRTLISRTTEGGEYYVANAKYTNISNSIKYVGICVNSAASTKYTILSVVRAASEEGVLAVDKQQQLTDTQKVQGLNNLGISGIDNTPTNGSGALITSGGVESTLYHHYGVKEITTSQANVDILQRTFDYGNSIAIRIVEFTGNLGSSGFGYRVTFDDNTYKSGSLPSTDWVVLEAESGHTISKIYIYKNATTVSVGGVVKAEVIFKDAFDSLIKDSSVSPISTKSITSKGVYPFATSAFRHKCGKNLCNPKDPEFKIGYYLSNGLFVEHAGYGVTGYIPVSQNGLVFNHYVNNRGYEVFDSDYNFLREVKNTDGVYTYESGDAFVRYTFNASDRDIIQVEEGSTSTSFEEYNPFDGYFAAFKEWSNARFALTPVSPEQISFLHNYNLFNKDTGRDYESGMSSAIDDNIWGAYLYNNELKSNSSYGVTAYIPVGQSQFYAHKIGGTNIRWICYYDADKIYLSTDTISGSTAVFTPPTNAYYARITFYMSNKDEFMVTFDTAPTEFVPYGKYVIDDIFMGQESGGDEEESVPEIVMPSVIYTLLGEQASIYHNEYINAFDPYAYYVQKGSGSSWNFHERCWRRESDAAAGSVLKLSLKNRLTKAVIQDINVTMQTAAKSAGTTAIKVSCIGDSFCYAGVYVKHISDTCSNITMVGMRTLSSGVKGEGRGGWKLSSYMNPKSSDIALNHMQPFSPFMHASGYNYYGVMEFWASIVNNTSQYTYGTNGFDNYINWFDTNGRKANPSTNDLVYNQTAGKFEYWNGSAWVQLATDPTFAFDYAKYLEIWQIDCPDFVVVQLGTNDFYDNDAGFDAWKANMDLVINSINACATAQSKTVKIIICTVLTISGLGYNNYGDGYVEKSRKYWEMRKKTIEAFDTATYRTSKNVYIADTGTSVDDKYGFAIQGKKPFEYYEGDETEPYNFNGVHPSSAGYKQFGTCIAGAIQCLRT